jgi:hypothetical protein
MRVTNQTLTATSSDGDKLSITVHGSWTARDLLRGVSQIIVHNKTGSINPSIMSEIMIEAEQSIVSVYGPVVKVPKTEPEVDRAKSVADMKADLVKRELKHAKWRFFVLGWTLSFFCSALLRVIFGNV